MRLDVLVSEKLSVSRTRAQNVIKTGGVTRDGIALNKPSLDVDSDDSIVIVDTLKYASLGGLKLENALRSCDKSVKDKICLDIGAANGGFTDCLLRHGAAHVTAVDVTIAFPPELLRDPRITICDGVNVKEIGSLFAGDSFDCITVDLSFISLCDLFCLFASLIKPNGELMALFKPQFEVGRRALPKSGVIRDAKLLEKTFRRFCDSAKAAGLKYECDAPVPALFPDKNKERTVFFRK